MAPIRVLNVAEKPSVAREVSRLLSNGGTHSRRGPAQYNPILEFPYNINGQPADMTFTSVAGHLMEIQFAERYRKWGACSPVELYNAPIVKQVPEDKKNLKKQLEQLARQAQWLVLWLDCDREGENICFELMSVCQAVNPRLVIKRARFSALVARELHQAMSTLGVPNELDSKAVDARQEIDLRVGASFSRFQTKLLQDKFDWQAGGLANEKPLISYGPCQFPTLGLIVQRAWEIQSHVSEPFWYIHLSYAEAAPSKARCDFVWSRGRLFNENMAAMLYEACVENPVVRILSVRGHQRFHRAPVPLSTLEMQKKATQYLRLPGERIMKLAEELYQGGFISYPRTETDQFSENQDLMALVRDQVRDRRWGAHAARIADGGMWKPPRSGGHDDKAHPPIHPVKPADGEGGWPDDKRRLYEFIVRSFLAACSKDAVGFETQVMAEVAGEGFRTTGLMVTERNWLEVYPWASWGGNSHLPTFTEGQTLQPTELTLKQGATQPPPRLSERDLIAKMEAHGIGTDATVAEHIQKQLDRGYAEKDAGMCFWPTKLGEALISGYRAMRLDNLWRPDLRGRIENQIRDVAMGHVAKEQVLANAIDSFRDDFTLAQQRCAQLEQAVGRFFDRPGAPRAAGPAGPGNGPGGGGGGGPGGGGGGGGGGPGGGMAGGAARGAGNNGPAGAVSLGPCPQCYGNMVITRTGPARRWAIQCLRGAQGLCTRLYLPMSIQEAFTVQEDLCAVCSARAAGLGVSNLHVRADAAALPPGLLPSAEYAGCAMCDPTMMELIQVGAEEARGDQAGGPRQPQAGAQRAPDQPRGGDARGPMGPGAGGDAGGGTGARGGRKRGGSAVMRVWSSDEEGDGGGGSGDDDGGRGGGRRGRGGSQAKRARGASTRGRSKTRGGAASGGSGGGARAGGSGVMRGGGGGGGRGGSGRAPPRCPMHNNPCLKLQARQGANAGRTFLKCAHATEGQACLRFLWEDEWDGSDPVRPGGR